MIVRRVIEHVKAQNWTAVGIDFVSVGGGVVIGIYCRSSTLRVSA